jgi:excinuclease ABC subunit A
MHKFIQIRGAKEHNLKNINIDIPRDQLVVITGLSGSGKSSLAFDTLYAEGQRRYVESLSAYARQFLEMMQKPDVESIEGLSPAISIEQKTTSKNPRSTVGTVTEIYDYMRLLWARIGIPYSPATGLPIESQTVSQMVDRIMGLDDGVRLYVIAPVVRGRKGEFKQLFAELQAKGFQRVRVNNELYEIDEAPTLDKKYKHDIDVIVDRLVIRDDLGNRLADSVETALRLSDGLMIAENADNGEQILFSEKFACPVSGFTISEIEPRLFSFNSPHGACPTCDGLGVESFFDPDLLVPDPDKSLSDGAVEPWSKTFAKFYTQALEGVAKHYGDSMRTPWKDLREETRKTILYGSGTEAVDIKYRGMGKTMKSSKPFEGVIPSLKRRLKESETPAMHEEMAKYQTQHDCGTCEGARLKPEALAVKIHGATIAYATSLNIKNALQWFADLPQHLSAQHAHIAEKILKEITDRLTFLNNVGLDYMTLNRASGTLSGGESQRIRLASQIGSGLTGVMYVLDEPSIGLHQRDNDRLLETLRRLRDLGNSVIVVEHDEDAIRSADYLIDMGVGAGIHGGSIVAEGTPDHVMQCKDSITADYLMGRREIPIPKQRRTGKKDQMITVHKASGNNLKNITASIPLGVMTCVTGVSGSGKSTFTIETLFKAASRKIMRTREQAAPHESIDGLEFIDKVIDIDQSPIGRTPRSNPMTYTGAFTPIREWYAGLPEAKMRGYSAGRFSFNVKGGRCEACQGDGVIKIEMHFLPDVYVTCEACNGKRYNRETLEILHKGKSIADVLDMSIEEGLEFFRPVPKIRDRLQTLMDVGLGYIQLGQAANTLSGGEAQRVKLSKELSKRSTGRTLYILDEPTTGLHFEDVRKLMEVLHTLVDQGNSVVIIEHNLDVIKTADWVIDIGSEGGDKGGEIVAVGTPETIAQTKGSYTGQYLKEILGRDKIKKAS